MDLRLYCLRYSQLPFGPPAQLSGMSLKLSPGPGSISKPILSTFPSFLDKHALLVIVDKHALLVIVFRHSTLNTVGTQ